jgi:hypothetical protein
VSPQENAYAVILFESVSHSLRAEKLVQAANIRGRLIPVPRHLSSDCGVCLRFDLSDRKAVEDALSGKIEYFQILPL